MQSGASRRFHARFELAYRDDPYPSPVRKLLLAPIQKAASRPRLRGSDHSETISLFLIKCVGKGLTTRYMFNIDLYVVFRWRRLWQHREHRSRNVALLSAGPTLGLSSAVTRPHSSGSGAK